MPDPQNFGVAQLDGDRVRKIVEKPLLRNHCNAGIYVIEPDVVSNARPFDGRVYVIILDDKHTAALRSANFARPLEFHAAPQVTAGDLCGALARVAGRSRGPAAAPYAAAGSTTIAGVLFGFLFNPRVGILATGNELAPVGAELGRDQIPDSNSVGLAAQAREMGAEARARRMRAGAMGSTSKLRVASALTTPTAESWVTRKT